MRPINKNHKESLGADAGSQVAVPRYFSGEPVTPENSATFSAGRLGTHAIPIEMFDEGPVYVVGYGSLVSDAVERNTLRVEPSSHGIRQRMAVMWDKACAVVAPERFLRTRYAARFAGRDDTVATYVSKRSGAAPPRVILIDGMRRQWGVGVQNPRDQAEMAVAKRSFVDAVTAEQPDVYVAYVDAVDATGEVLVGAAAKETPLGLLAAIKRETLYRLLDVTDRARWSDGSPVEGRVFISIGLESERERFHQAKSEGKAVARVGYVDPIRSAYGALNEETGIDGWKPSDEPEAQGLKVMDLTLNSQARSARWTGKARVRGTDGGIAI